MTKVSNAKRTNLIGGSTDYRYFPIEYPTNIFAIALTEGKEGYNPCSCHISNLDKSKFLLLPKGDPNNHFADIISIGH